MPSHLTLWLAAAAWDTMTKEAKTHFPLETGGVLCGYWSNKTEAVCLEASGPGAEAIHGSRSFCPDYVHQEQWLTRQYAQSSGAHYYLGDWHTHPGCRQARPSGKDLGVLSKIANYKPARLPRPTMIILFGECDQWDATCWTGDRRCRLLRRLAVRRLALRHF
jgi:integrative and conjugative element protein (TIGR02256 family)